MIQQRETATYVLMGLKYQQPFINQLLKGVEAMEESSTYQYIVAKGKTEGAREEAKKLLLLLGRDRFGPPSKTVQAELETIQDLRRLEALGLRLGQVGSWQELLGSERNGWLRDVADDALECVKGRAEPRP